jgi:hypothetical protein
MDDLFNYASNNLERTHALYNWLWKTCLFIRKRLEKPEQTNYKQMLEDKIEFKWKTYVLKKEYERFGYWSWEWRAFIRELRGNFTRDTTKQAEEARSKARQMRKNWQTPQLKLLKKPNDAQAA